MVQHKSSGTDRDSVNFGWKVEEQEEQERQASFQILLVLRKHIFGTEFLVHQSWKSLTGDSAFAAVVLSR